MIGRIASAALAAGAAAAALWLAWHHPVAPWAARAGVVGWMALAAWRPQTWLFVLPALLPLANFSPWTGWIAFEEFDLLVLGTIAAGHARLAFDAAVPARTWRGIALLFVLLGLPGLLLGVADAGGWGGVDVGWFDGYVDPVNTWRVAKGGLYVLALLPLLARAFGRDEGAAARRFASGMVAGIAVVAVAVLWERDAYPGLFDITRNYRVTALFWEMHVGGAAIDAYLALATPFVAWTLWASRTRGRWALAALLALGVCHAALITFSRGVYGAVALPLLGLGLWLWARRWLSSLRWRSIGAALLCVGLAVEIIGVLLPGSFMTTRMARSARDYDSRIAHWQHGIDLLHGPRDWLLGLGLGRLPANYSRFTLGGGVSGSARVVTLPDGPALRLAGPRSDLRLVGLYGLTQQVPAAPGYQLSFEARSPSGGDIEIRVCDSHLLYDGDCQGTFARLGPTRAWLQVVAPLAGPPIERDGTRLQRDAVLTLAVTSLGEPFELRHLKLQPLGAAPDAPQLLRNGDFAQGLAHWLPSAQYYFLPWHIDNLYLELLIERGLLGQGATAALVIAVLRRLSRAARGDGPAAWLAPFVVAGLAGGLLVGAVSSVFDVPRVAFLWWLLLAVGWQLGRTPPVRGPAMT